MLKRFGESEGMINNKNNVFIDSFYKLDWEKRAMNFKLMRDLQVDLEKLFALRYLYLIDNEPKKKKFLTKENI